MTYLEVPGASLYYESVGQGPMLLCISGADGSCEIWRGFATCLAEHFNVVMWDRRGFSRSHLNGPQDYAQRLEGDADDASRLIAHLSPDSPATVIGNSSGAIIALKLLVRHPALIRTLVAYEPPAARVLPDFADLWAQHEKIYALWRQGGAAPALAHFCHLTRTDPAQIQALLDPRVGPYVWSNLQYWFEREFMHYPRAPLDPDAELRPLKDKLLFVNGERSDRAAYQYRANEVMAERLGAPLHLLPGEHVSHATHAPQFSAKLLDVLRTKDEFYAQV